jgi:hypothetical protein
MTHVRVHSKTPDSAAFWDDQLKRFAQSIAQESFSSKANETQDSLRSLDTKLTGISKVVKLQHEISENREAQFSESLLRIKGIEQRTEKIGHFEGRLESLENKIDSFLATNCTAYVEDRLQRLEVRADDAVSARSLAKELEISEDKLIRVIHDSQVSAERREELLMQRLLEAFATLQERVDDLSVRSYRKERSKSVENASSLELSRAESTLRAARDTTAKSLRNVSPIKPVRSKRLQSVEQAVICDIFPSSRGSRTESHRRSPISDLAETSRKQVSERFKGLSIRVKPAKKKIGKRRSVRPQTAKPTLAKVPSKVRGKRLSK